MESGIRIESVLDRAVAYAEAPGAPPMLAEAIRYAVFPGGHRIRPRLCLSVARACGEDDPAAADSAAAAIELLHCASLVHDDLPCFDDAATRRGRPSVHRAFGAPLAVLAGDALIVLAFQVLAQGAARAPDRLAPLVATVGAAVGVPCGIVAGQAWECEPWADLAQYQRQKTGALFAAAAMAGAAASGHAADRWRRTGALLGEAYQIADDIRDATATADEIGKPVGRDAALGRPNAVLQLGLAGAVGRLTELVDEAVAAVPPCSGAAGLRSHVRSEARRLVPAELSHHAHAA
jgi:geranylgeranyl diphosphate synthase, type II